MKVTVCIGSSCHIKGSRQVVEQLQALIAEKGLDDKVELGGTFCMGKCQQGVCVCVGEELFSVQPETTKAFFEEPSITLTGSLCRSACCPVEGRKRRGELPDAQKVKLQELL